MNIDGSDRQKKYPTPVKIDNVKNKKDETERKILVIKDDSQRPNGKISGILIVVSGSKTSIELPDQKLVSPVLSILKREQDKFPWKGIHEWPPRITTRIELTDIEIEEIKSLLERTIRL
jgi:hypothetical protein